jgi:glycosyltransferase involved in cell wall biosynthesis
MNFAALSLLYCNINAKLIFDDHMLISQVDRSLIGKMIYMIYRVFITPQIIKKATKVVAISEGCIPILNQFFGIPLDRISLIPLGADDNLFSYSDKKRIEIRNRHVINLDSIVVIFTGKLIKRKGLEKISEALEIIDSEKKIHILIVGSGSEEYKRELINTFNSRNHSFTIHPFVSSEELVGYFCAADIAVYPVEATISTVEASSCSLPIICTNEIPERYKNGNGFGIEPGNIKQLKEALFILIEDEELRKKMGRKGRELVENELSWSKVSNNFLSSIEH